MYVHIYIDRYAHSSMCMNTDKRRRNQYGNPPGSHHPLFSFGSRRLEGRLQMAPGHRTRDIIMGRNKRNGFA